MPSCVVAKLQFVILDQKVRFVSNYHKNFLDSILLQNLKLINLYLVDG